MTTPFLQRIAEVVQSSTLKPCRIATTEDISLSGNQTIDGIATIPGDRVLVWQQTDPAENGIYVVYAGSWQRSADFNGTGDIVTGSVVAVFAGDTYGNNQFQVTFNGEPTFGSTQFVFGMISFQAVGTQVQASVEQVADIDSEVQSVAGVAPAVQALASQIDVIQDVADGIAVEYDDFDLLRASTEAARGAGAIWLAGEHRLVELAAAATDYHVTTTAGVKLKLLQSTTDGRGKIRPGKRNAVIAMIGDSIIAGGEFRVAYENDWFATGGVFEGYTRYNLASNGSPASSWAANISAGNQSETPVDYAAPGNPNYNPWAAVNAAPDEILFGLGTNDLRMDGSAGSISDLRQDIASLITFLLERTDARILMMMPPPYAYRNPDPDSFTNFVDADDAAARSAALRTIYLEWENVSSRVVVFDSHKALYGYRIDDIAAATEPEGQIDFLDGGSPRSLMKDSLHPTNTAQSRVGQIIARSIDASLPFTTEVKRVAPVSYQDCSLSCMVEVRGGGSGYIDIYADSLQRLTGVLGRTTPRGPLNNIRQAETLAVAGAASILRNILRSRRFAVSYVDGSATETILEGFTYSYNVVDGINDYWRISATGTFSGSGFATAFVQTDTNLPQYPAMQLPLIIPISGALPLTSGAAEGAAAIPALGVSPAFSASTIHGTRESNSGAATVDIYACNRFDWAYDDGTTVTASPGLKIGTVTFPNGHYCQTQWAKDSTNFPSGDPVLPVSSNANTVLRAILQTGSLGDHGAISIRAR